MPPGGGLKKSSMPSIMVRSFDTNQMILYTNQISAYFILTMTHRLFYFIFPHIKKKLISCDYEYTYLILNIHFVKWKDKINF